MFASILRSFTLVLLMSGTALAAPLSFRLEATGLDFNPDPGVASGIGTFTARIDGLLDNATGQSASAVVFETVTAFDGTSLDPAQFAFGPDAIAWSDVFFNSFDVENHQIVSADFLALGDNRAPSGAGISLDVFSLFVRPDEQAFVLTIGTTGFGADLNLVGEPGFDAFSLSFTPIAVPLPGAAWMLLAGLVGFGVVIGGQLGASRSDH